MSALPPEPQPDVLAPDRDAPSFWLYGAITGASAVLICIAFHIQKEPDWAGLFINLASGLIGAVVVLVVVERRLRRDEVEALRKLPRSGVQAAYRWLTPTGRFRHRYCRSLLLSLNTLLNDKVPLPTLEAVEKLVRRGGLIVAAPGTGKTTSLQMAAQSLAREAIAGEAGAKLPIILRLTERHAEQGLEKSLYQFVSSFSSYSERRFERLLSSGNAIVILDGYDELAPQAADHFSEQIKSLRKRHPNLAITITSRPSHDFPFSFGLIYDLPTPTSDQISMIRSVRARRNLD